MPVFDRNPHASREIPNQFPALTLGIPYRPGGQCLRTNFEATAAALDRLDSNLSREVIVCVNGAKTEDVAEVACMLRSSSLARHRARVITSSPGKLSAQRAIVAKRELSGVVGFVDSDVVLHPKALRRLWDRFEATPGCQVVYAQPVPVMPEQTNLLHRLLRVHYSLRDRAYTRPFIHGRAFLMREWMDCQPSGAIPAPEQTDHLDLRRGPLVDDIYLSRLIVARWGTEVIQEVRDANVFFDPPDTLQGLYAAALRVAWEVERLDALYPEHTMLQKTIFNRRWRTSFIRRRSLRLRAAHHAYRILEAAIKRLAGVRARLARQGIVPLRNPWIEVPGTKGLRSSQEVCSG